MKFGIDLGGSHVAIGLVDENSEIIEKRTYMLLLIPKKLKKRALIKQMKS